MPGHGWPGSSEPVKENTPTDSLGGEGARLLQTRQAAVISGQPPSPAESVPPSIPASLQPRGRPGTGTPRVDPSRLAPLELQPAPGPGERPTAAGRGRAVPSAALSGSWCRAGSWPRPTRCRHRGSSRRRRAVTAAASGGPPQRPLSGGRAAATVQRLPARARRGLRPRRSPARCSSRPHRQTPAPPARTSSRGRLSASVQPRPRGPPPSGLQRREPPPPANQIAPATPPSAPAANEWRRPIAEGESTSNLRAS